MTTAEERPRCKCCHRPLSHERISHGLKTCSPRCSQRRRRWRDPLELRRGQLISLSEKLVWNDQQLRAKLGVSKAELSDRLLALARSRGWEVAWGRDGLVNAIGYVPVRRMHHLSQAEVRPRP